MEKSLYENKYFSVLGDSISTLYGYTEPKEAVFYDNTMKFIADVFTPSDTWWGMVIEALGGKILVNNSISGSMVIKAPDCEIESYGCSDERTSALSRGTVSPDVIMLFMGMNDFGYGVPLKPDYPEEEGSLAIFSEAYRIMLGKLKKNYENAEIWCFTLPVSFCSSHEQFVFPVRRCGKHIDEFCEIIRNLCAEYDCKLIDLYRVGTPHDTVDGFHPNLSGMRTVADAVISQI